MKRHNYLALSLAAVITASTSCSKSEPEPCTTITIEPLTACCAYRLEGSAGDFNSDSDLVWLDTVAIMMPTVIYDNDVEPLRRAILGAAFGSDTIQSDVEISSLMGGCAIDAGYDTLHIAVTADMATSSDGLHSISGNICSLTPTLLTYRINSYTYMPRAAHGMYTNTYITYDISKGDIITLEDIFTAEGLEALPALIARQARRMASILGTTRITALPVDGNFYIDLDGTLAFIYQPYEVASYAQGEIAVPFYPYKLSEHMTPRGLALFGLDN